MLVSDRGLKEGVMRCPHCNKNHPVRDVVLNNAEAYGGSTSHLPCDKCEKMIKVRTTRLVRVISVEKSDRPRSEGDW